MKRLSNLLAVLVFASLVIFMSCGGGSSAPAPTAAELAADKLDGTWSVVADNVTYDGGPEGDWTGFTLGITASSTGGKFTPSSIPNGYEDVWPSSNWTFNNDNATKIIRSSDDVTITYNVNNAGTKLTMDFTVPDPNARTSGLYDAEWHFEFTK